MRRDLPSCRKKVNTRKVIEQPIAQHFTQSTSPNLSRVLDIASVRLGTSGCRQNLSYARTILRDRLYDFRLRSVRQTQRHLNFALEFIRARKIGFVDDEHLSDLHNTRFKRLNIVSRARREDHQSHMSQPCDLDFVLPHADGFDQDHVPTRGIQEHDHFSGRTREAAQRSAGRHGTDKDPRIGMMILHANAIAQNRSTGIGAAGIHSDHRNRLPFPPKKPRKLIAECAFSGAWRTGDTYDERVAGVREKLAQQRLRFRTPVLDPRCGASQGTKIAIQDLFDSL